jgi:uncharacterized membrane protein
MNTTNLNLHTHTKSHSTAQITDQRSSPLPDDQLTSAGVIGWILQGGTSASALLIMTGLLLLLMHPASLRGLVEKEFPHTLTQIWQGLLILQPQAIIVIGLLLLIATPVLRVVVSIFTFSMEHDRLYMLIAILLLAILLTSFLLGKGGA